MFHSFENQAERQAYGGSAFLELQYCKMENGTAEKKLVSVRSLRHWQDDSLYLHADDLAAFLQSYRSVFSNGLYGNMAHGEIDAYGINYYSPAQVTGIMRTIEALRPIGYRTLFDWLRNASQYNGIYILGL